jgi:hypothetical protein
MSPKKQVHKGERCFENFSSKNWKDLNEDGQLEAMQELERYMAEKQDRTMRTIEKTTNDVYGEFDKENPNVLYINLKKINSDKAWKGNSSYLAMDTVIHEGWHARQFDAINEESKERTADKGNLDPRGKNFICIIDSREPGYISSPIEAEAFGNTLSDMSGFSEKFKSLGDKELEKFEAFLEKRKADIKDRETEACKHYEVSDINEARQKTLLDIDKDYERLKDNAKRRMEAIKYIESDRATRPAKDIAGDIAYQIECFKEEQKCNYSPQEILRQMEEFENGRGLTVKEKSEGMSLNSSTKSIDEDKTPEKIPEKGKTPDKEPKPEKNHSKTDKERITVVIETYKEFEAAERKLTDPALKAKDRKGAEADMAQKEKAYSAAWGEITNRPNSEKLIAKIEKIQNAELSKEIQTKERGASKLH